MMTKLHNDRRQSKRKERKMKGQKRKMEEVTRSRDKVRRLVGRVGASISMEHLHLGIASGRQQRQRLL